MTPESPAAAAKYVPSPIQGEVQRPAREPAAAQPDRSRLMSVSSVVDEVRNHVANLSAVPAQNLPEWLQSLDVPPGWQLAQIGTDAVPLGRVVLSGHKPEGGWEGCETLSLFGFNGTLPENVLTESADRTLRDLDADNVNSISLTIAADSSAAAVRSSGYFTTSGRRVWAQYSTYVGRNEGGEEGFLIEHAIYIDAAQRPLLRHDVEDMGDAVHSAFLGRLVTVDPTTPNRI
ncbi:hypothetical protein [Mycolicibacterium komossense]|uniref:Uncharacterized protein n=1 Tax=Mycolicibacterium komossense TaxID=1779 RepID=A0ABT3CHS4_9MYCO|nr:hypothetical protein [Mycolicibacterium komossense]MCV7229094.1 hypothetical protein [Mycolicibacterium komossense]